MLTNIYLTRPFRWLITLTLVGLLLMSLTTSAVYLCSLLDPDMELRYHRGVVERYEALLSKSELAQTDKARRQTDDETFLTDTVQAIMADNGTIGYTPAEYVSRLEAEVARCTAR